MMVIKKAALVSATLFALTKGACAQEWEPYYDPLPDDGYGYYSAPVEPDYPYYGDDSPGYYNDNGDWVDQPRRQAEADGGPRDDDLAMRSKSPIARTIVPYSGYAPGTIIISTKERRLYLMLDDRTAMRYGVGVGKQGFSWKGQETISKKREWPDWRPPKEMIARKPELPDHMEGGIKNPLGARALYLGTTLYRIHGTNEPKSIGKAVSSGCIRMANPDVIDLYNRVEVGAAVVVL